MDKGVSIDIYVYAMLEIQETLDVLGKQEKVRARARPRAWIDEKDVQVQVQVLRT